VFNRSAIFRNQTLFLAFLLVVFNILITFLDGLIIAMVISVLPILYYLFFNGKYWLVIISLSIVMPLVVKFNDFKAEFRELTWHSGGVSMSEKVGILVSLFSKEQIVEEGTELIVKSSEIRRAHSYHYFQRALYEHEKGKEFLMGSTYWIILIKPIPRLIWSDKPKEESGSVIAKQYNMLDQSDNSTSMNLPLWVEFYINYGRFGLFVGSLIMTLFFIYFSVKTRIDPNNYIDTGVKLALIIPFLGIESNLSLMVGGFLGLIGFLILKKLFVGDSKIKI
jgi:hypothetical protein